MEDKNLVKKKKRWDWQNYKDLTKSYNYQCKGYNYRKDECKDFVVESKNI